MLSCASPAYSSPSSTFLFFSSSCSVIFQPLHIKIQMTEILDRSVNPGASSSSFDQVSSSLFTVLIVLSEIHKSTLFAPLKSFFHLFSLIRNNIIPKIFLVTVIFPVTVAFLFLKSIFTTLSIQINIPHISTISYSQSILISISHPLLFFFFVILFLIIHTFISFIPLLFIITITSILHILHTVLPLHLLNSLTSNHSPSYPNSLLLPSSFTHLFAYFSLPLFSDINL